METFLTVGAIVACVLLFSFAVFIHEFGHFLAAKLLGFRVDVFSIGFGPALWKHTWKGVEYRLSLIPFGGYVALPQLDPEGTKGIQGTRDGEEPLQEAPAWKRVIVAFAGPFGNVVLAVTLAFGLSAVPTARFGRVEPVVGSIAQASAAAQSGLRAGDRVCAVDGHDVADWNDVRTAAALAGSRAVDYVISRGGSNVTVRVTGTYNADLDTWMLPAEPSVSSTISAVKEGSAAARAGLLPGDCVTAIDGMAVNTFAEVKARVETAAGREMTIVYRRDGQEKVAKAVAERSTETGGWLLGIYAGGGNETASWMPDRSPLKQLAWDAGQIFRVLRGLVTPKESKTVASALGGPVMIAQVLYRQVRHDAWDAIGFLRFLNVNLAVLNLLPLPVLDGGLILLALLELIFRRRPPKKIVDTLTMGFMWLLLALMIFLVYRDVARSRRVSRLEAQLEARQLDEKRVRERLDNFRPAFDLGGEAQK